MKLEYLVSALPEASIEGNPDVEIKKIEYDSRRVRESDLFVAIKGYSADGHNFIHQAVSNGAIAVVLEEDRKLRATVKIRVPNSRRALALLSSRFYEDPWRKLKVIGITGTNGKTTVCFLVKSILEAGSIPTGLLGTVKYQVGGKTLPALITTPESSDLHRLLGEMVKGGDRAAVVEVSSHGLALDRTYGIEFKTAVFTNLSRDHLDFHRSFQDYLNAKAILFERLRAEEGKAVINLDDPAALEIIRRTEAPVLTYGFSGKAHLHSTQSEVTRSGTHFRARTPAGEMDVSLKLRGEFNIPNALAAAAVGLTCGIDLQTIKAGLESVESIPGRLEPVECGQDFMVLVDYAHTPSALESVLKTARGLTSGRVISVFGCGGDRDRGKRPEMGEISGRIADISYITSDNPRTEDPQAIIQDIISGMSRCDRYEAVSDRREAISKALKEACRGDVVVVAGKGHEDYQILGTKRIHLDDRETVREILETI